LRATTFASDCLASRRRAKIMSQRPEGSIAVNLDVARFVETRREVVDVGSTDFTDVSAVVLSAEDLSNGIVSRLRATGFDLPLFVVSGPEDNVDLDVHGVTGVLASEEQNADLFGRMVETSAARYDEVVLPPFFGALARYERRGYSPFDCPGHQGGQFFMRHPAGRRLVEFFGENLFRADLCNADVSMGDLLIHEGAALEAEKHAARVFHSDQTYFVLNGTSASNKVALGALLTPGDVVLFDRNNHKSVHHGALFLAAATPVYLETSRNEFGLIGGIDEHCLDESYIRARVATAAPEKADAERPVRLAVIQLGTYDGTIYNARQVVDRIGGLCDYILFDSAWVGYEQFIPMMRDCSPLLLELGEGDPGIIVTQSVHKQQAGFSQASQIHKKDAHIRGQSRYVNHDRFNNAFMMQASTSPFYPIFASLDVNAQMHDEGSGERLWAHAVEVGIEARKMILKSCSMVRPFVPERVNGSPWQDAATATIATDREYFAFVPGERWHGFDGYAKDQYFVDPNKLTLTTPGLDMATGQYEEFGIPATILANYLRENGIIPEKCDLNSILFLLTPAETIPKVQNLVAQLMHFEELVQRDASLEHVLPSIVHAHRERYAGYTIRQLAQEMHDFYKERDVKQLQKVMFREKHFPRVACAPHLANDEFTRGNVDLVALRDIEGRVAAGSCASFPARSGAQSNARTSSRSKRASTSRRASRQNFKAFTSRRRPAGRFARMATCCRSRRPPSRRAERTSWARSPRRWASGR
jgi:ornithine decarboxylase